LSGRAIAGEETGSEEKSTLEEAKETQEVAVIETKFGKIVLEFYPDVAPNHVDNFKKLAIEGFYNGTTFHRVIPGFVIQGGCPNSKDDDRSNDGTGGPGYTIDAEFNSRKHLRGTLSMARSMDPNSAGSQFYICVKNQPSLDEKYTVFGQVTEGMDVVDKIVSVKRDQRDNPIEPIAMEKVSIEKREK
jgi:peptidyl-prolyl cis-trans isomerase B (cyclophilin B)